MSTKNVSDRSSYPNRVFSHQDEDPKVLESIEQIFLSRRGYVFQPPLDEDVVLIYSGGLDSTTVIDMIINDWGVKIFPLFVRRSARATKYEEAAVRFFTQYYVEKYPGKMGELEVVETEVPPLAFKHYAETDRLQRLGHPLRNVVLQSLGVQYAQKLRSSVSPNLRTVITATVGDDTFPHSSLAAIRTLNLAACIDSGDWSWQITSPLIDTQLPNRPLFKRDLIQYAMEAGLPLDKTRTCVEAGEPDGTCTECSERIEAFRQLGITDPIQY